MNRLKPSLGSGRYFVLKKLGNALEFLVNQTDKFGRVLDYGAKDSPYRKLLNGKYDEYVSADFDVSAEAGIELNPDGSVPLQDETFDTIISTQVLEHVLDPNLYLSEVYRLLKPGGRLILSTHGYWKYHPDPTDFWRWTKDGLILTVKTNKFEIQHCLSVMGLSASGLQLFQDGIAHRIPRLLKPMFFSVIALSQSILDKNTFEKTDASVYVVLATRQ